MVRFKPLVEMKVRAIPEQDGTFDVVEFAAGLQLPAKLLYSEMDVDGVKHGYDVDYRIEFQSDRYQCAEMRMRQRPGGPPVTGEAIRRMTVAEDVRNGLRLATLDRMGKSDDGIPRLGFIEGVRPPEGIAEQGLTDEVLRWVSQIYELALAVNDPPTKTVQDQLGVSRATAGRWVAEARRCGLLPEQVPDA